MGVNEILQFLVMAREHSKPQHLIADLEHLLAAYKISFYGVISQPKPSPDPISRVLAGRWPEGWPERYIEKKYILVDPTIRYLPRADGGFSWKSALKFFESNSQRNKMQKMLDDARTHGLSKGYVFPVHSPHGLVGNMTISGKDLDLSALEISLFEQAAKVTLLELLRMTQDGEQQFEDETGEATARELEILTYLSDGLTSQEISDILNISSNTVDWHVNSLQEKYGARNRQHTVAIAFRRGLII